MEKTNLHWVNCPVFITTALAKQHEGMPLILRKGAFLKGTTVVLESSCDEEGGVGIHECSLYNLGESDGSRFLSWLHH